MSKRVWVMTATLGVLWIRAGVQVLGQIMKGKRMSKRERIEVRVSGQAVNRKEHIASLLRRLSGIRSRMAYAHPQSFYSRGVELDLWSRSYPDLLVGPMALELDSGGLDAAVDFLNGYTGFELSDLEAVVAWAEENGRQTNGS